MHKAGIKSYACDLTAEITQSRHLPNPQFTFTDSLKLELNNEEIICYYPGPGHSLDNIVIWIPDKKILFGGCLIKALRSNTLGNTRDADLEEWPKTLKKLQKKFSESQLVIPGHGNHGGLDLIDHTLNLLTNH